ncbi:hypothetical protein HY500_02780 [Candidatus Woesearchaeota archaeon]|nr:hypothetical protein [Candidatus Woesearchaeota archaeon]
MRELFRRGLARLNFRRQASRGKKITKTLLHMGKSETLRIKDALKKETKREMKRVVSTGKREARRIKAELKKSPGRKTRRK